MADVPPSIVGSSLQAGFHQSDVAKARDAQRAEQGHAARSGVKSIDEAGTTIETTDEDTAVFTDAEGAGGQGRHSEEESSETSHDKQDTSSDGGLTTGPDGQAHLDVQA